MLTIVIIICITAIVIAAIIGSAIDRYSRNKYQRR
jgi:hypothetical protein